MKSGRLTATSDLPLPAGSYIYQILPITSQMVVISSDDSIGVIDPPTLRAIANRGFSNVHAGVTCARAPKRSSDVLITSGRDAKVKSWDLRTNAQTTDFQDSIAHDPLPLKKRIGFTYTHQVDSNASYLSLACNDLLVAAGTEWANHQAAVSIWYSPTKQLRTSGKLKNSTGTTETLQVQFVDMWRVITTTLLRYAHAFFRFW